MVSQTEATTSRIQKEHARHHSSAKEDFSFHGNVGFCQISPLYASGEESAASTLATLTKEAKLATVEVKALGDKALAVCKSLIAGGVVGRVSRSAVAPLEQFKILLQAQNPLKTKYNGTASSAIKWLYRRETGQEDAELTPFLRLGVGACATMSARYPMELVRGRLVVQTKDSPMHCRGMFHEASMIMKEEGPLAIYKGFGALYKVLLPNFVKVVPSIVLVFLTYEGMKDLLGVECQISD
ncbi:hypothetical protein GOP47_0011374 [Adiantum capillus-veneris]|uniref:Uncharacterized protein n=1 Tax=Adiantum capillus-veneris TaxID=13818 RepID=A0A9D4ZHT1_ADICA|nr:hypothetical protein GOP47_0011374 [Adiantum capillus-veneris]